MKRLVAAMAVILSLATMSCTKSEESLQPNQSEIESKRRPGGGSGVSNTVPQVTGLTASATGRTQVSLAWNGVTNAQGYWIYRTTGGVEYVPAIVQTTNYVDASVSPGTTYTYAVAAVVSTYLGPRSVSVTVTTPQ